MFIIYQWLVGEYVMGSINSRQGKLYLDFRYRVIRCRELIMINLNVYHVSRLMIFMMRSMK
ncbi:Arm DNA-binding domain-containing protein [Photobacterium leiognathi]|uniref:Arm DNA-binding domain-containing protein n=1 Tax=Photobacterium leiognathi TaxID=553611 RepID=UPI0029821202|nr:DUF3596 domain-containing protein [Photobacterium leiognathi]